jgi:hypothetical protein
LTVVKGFGAGRSVEEFLVVQVIFGLDGQFRAAGGVVFYASAPIEIAGPALDGAEGGADFPADGGEAAFGAEFEVSAEGLKGAVGFSPCGGERGGRLGAGG